ncbi:hypothetical protein ACP70R_050404 [Stipagrostis hirtigluma subsp. patula]
MPSPVAGAVFWRLAAAMPSPVAGAVFWCLAAATTVGGFVALFRHWDLPSKASYTHAGFRNASMRGTRSGAFGDFIPHLLLSVMAFVRAGFCKWPTLAPRSIGFAGDYIASRPVYAPLPGPNQEMDGIFCKSFTWYNNVFKRLHPGTRGGSFCDFIPHLVLSVVAYVTFTDGGPLFLAASGMQITGVGALGWLPRRLRRAGPLLTRSVCHHDIFLLCTMFVLFGIYKQLMAPPAIDDLARSNGDAGDDIVGCAPESERRRIGVAIPGGGCAVQCVWSLMARLSFNAERKARGWSNPFRLDCSTVGRLISPVTQQYISLAACFVRPIKQLHDDTCSIVACTVAVDVTHQLKYGFDWTAAEPEHLFKECEREGIWRPGEGASVEDVLNKIVALSGVPIVTDDPAVNSDPERCPRLPLKSFGVHKFEEDDDARRLSTARMVKLLRRGPCVGGLWTCPWYCRFDASRDKGAWVYCGCGRSQAARDESKRLYGHKAGSHAVVCFGYRFCGDQMHVLVLDNHADKTGPWRWIDAEELDTFYTLNID